jgi:exopolyphosphatase / guanosine-5'-triphosphate,3'-diphosphate pyrophosphatase
MFKNEAGSGVLVLLSLPPFKKENEVDATNDGVKPRKGRAGKGANKPRRVDSAGLKEAPYGALDLGTNNCRLLIARPSHQGLAVVDAFSRIVRLGEGLGTSGSLSEAAMRRTIEALRVCSNKLKWHKVGARRLIATEACRLAANGAEFIDRVAEETGLQLEIIDRETEARLAASGAEPLIDGEAESAVIFDIGGGSTEVMWMQRDGSGFALRAWTSLAAGVVTLSERLDGGRDVSPETFAAMRAHVKVLLEPFVVEVTAQQVGASPVPTHLLGTSGTVTTIAGVHLGLRHYDRSKVDGCWLDSEGAGAVTAQLLAMSYEERMANGCIGRERADLVLAGCAILEEIRMAFPAPRIRVADRGLREGILLQMMTADGLMGARA